MRVKIEVPDSLKDIKLSQYQKFIRTTKDSEDERFIAKQLVGIFCDIPDELVNSLSFTDFDRIKNIITGIINVDGDQKLKRIIEVDGKAYGFIPDLNDITVGEQADIDSMIGDWKNMHKVMGILYRPIKTHKADKYTIEDYKPGAELDLTMDVVQGALQFFFLLLRDLMTCTRSFIEEAAHDKRLQSLGVNGDGIKAYTDYLAEISSNLTTSLNLDFMRP